MSRNNAITETLSCLGLKSVHDTTTILPVDVFEKFPIITAATLRTAFNYDQLPIATAEAKFQLINRVLTQHYGMIIDSIKKIDDIDTEGYRLENLRGFGVI
jgi:hypothetical protein